MRGEWASDDTYRIADVEFVASSTDRFISTADRFCLVKSPDLVDRTLAILDDVAPGSIVELGLFQGGSAALMLLYSEPEVFIGVERAEKRIAPLDQLAARFPEGAVKLYYGLDQADAPALRDAVAAGLDGRRIDIVIDDASHLVGPTRSSFNTLFPLVRPGGYFVIEDWAWAHIGFGAHRPKEEPLSRIVFELTLALPAHPGLIDDIHIDRYQALIRRGDLEVDPSSFDLLDCQTPRARAMLAQYRVAEQAN